MPSLDVLGAASCQPFLFHVSFFLPVKSVFVSRKVRSEQVSWNVHITRYPFAFVLTAVKIPKIKIALFTLHMSIAV